MSKYSRICWGVLSRSRNKLDGYYEHLRGEPNGTTGKMLFRTRKEAREYIAKHCGYFKRLDLRSEPHGWLPSKAVRVEVKIRRLS